MQNGTILKSKHPHGTLDLATLHAWLCLDCHDTGEMDLHFKYDYIHILLEGRCCCAGVGMMVRDARASRKSIVRPPTGGSVEEQTQGVQLRPSKVGFRKSIARPSLAGNDAQEAAQDPNQRPSKFGPRKSMAPSTRAGTP